MVIVFINIMKIGGQNKLNKIRKMKMFNVTFVYNDKTNPENNVVWEDVYDYMTDVI